MTQLTYPLSVLVRAVAYKNLSSASLHVGLSQPQLSRLIARLETELKVELLNRQVKRKSSWTPQAMQLAQLFEHHQRRLDHAVRTLKSSHAAKQIHIGTLEGLSDLATQLTEKLFTKHKMELVILDIFDRSELEAKFLAGDLDVILNTRVPSRSKPRFIHRCGYQTLEHVEKGLDYQVYSSFEYNLRPRKAKEIFARTLVSNSLAIRKSWFEKIGGHGSLPTNVSEKFKKDADEVLLLGGDWMDPRLWQGLVTST